MRKSKGVPFIHFPILPKSFANQTIFEQILTQTDSNPEMAGEALDTLNLLFSSGALSTKQIWLDRDVDDIYVEMLIVTSLSMRRKYNILSRRLKPRGAKPELEMSVEE